jgi:hypothetical protein
MGTINLLQERECLRLRFIAHTFENMLARHIQEIVPDFMEK